MITVGSFDFPESVLLAYMYADALSTRGYPARVPPDLGSRELVDPALVDGLIQLVPEYTRSALEFASLGRAPAKSIRGPADATQHRTIHPHQSQDSADMVSRLSRR